jgi:hypothetical protein
MANSSYVIQDRIEVSIQINGTPYPLDIINFLHFLHIGWSTWTKVPTCHFAVSDAQHTLDKLNLQDGIPITISIKPYATPTVTYNFRKFHHKKTWNGTCFVYEIDGYWNNPLYWAGTATASFQGTSSDLLSYVASTCGLNYNGVSTNDAQLWLPRNRTYGEWVTSVVEKGYISENSYMVSGIDPTGTLFYKDVNNLPASTTNVVLGQFVQGSYTAVDYAPVANSGTLNKMQGYQHTRWNQSSVNTQTSASQTTPSLSSPLQTIDFIPDVTGYYLNQAISNQIQQGYRSFGGIDVGNTHPAYEQAIYQNRRMGSLFSLGVEFLMLTPSTISLFDKFTFAVDTESQQQDAPYAGTYTVAAKALRVQGATYAEKILGVRMGTNSSYVSA